MKIFLSKASFFVALLVLFCSQAVLAGNVDPLETGSQWAWGENAGWLNFDPAGDPSGGSGVTVEDTRVTGFVWAENAGWINLSPEICSGDDEGYRCGVTNDGQGNLSGWAWSESAGWISFSCETTDSCDDFDYGVWLELYEDPIIKIRFFMGFAWGENIGWINFNLGPLSVMTDWGPDGDGDGYGDIHDCDDSDDAISPGASDADCDGSDNNCSGEADDEYVPTPTECGVGTCAEEGMLECDYGVLTDTCTPGLPSSECGSETDSCKDGQDNDCDGLIDSDDPGCQLASSDQKITVSPATVNFSDVGVNPDPPPAIEVTLSNTGCMDLDITNADVTGVDSALFTMVDNCTIPATLAPGLSCTLTVIFTPTSGGDKSATLTITSTDPQNPSFAIPLNGTGWDSDEDGVGDAFDNCPDIPNPGQADADGDGRGDACDPCTDTDEDWYGDPGYPNPDCPGGPEDNCPEIPNFQSDRDGDGLGDACDGDIDGDGILNDGDGSGTPGDTTCAGGETVNCDDNCNYIANADQADADNDGVGDACEDIPGYDPNLPPPYTDSGDYPYGGDIYGDPLNLKTGAYLYIKDLMNVPGTGLPFVFTIYYNSTAERTTPAGYKWSHSYHWYVEELPDGDVAVRRGDGQADYFLKDGGDYLPKFSGVFSSLSEDSTGAFTYVTREGTSYLFDGSGMLAEIQDRNGNKIMIEYDDDSGLLAQIVDTRGNTATLDYDPEGYLLSVDYAGLQQVVFTHDSLGNLTQFTMVDGNPISFTYDASGQLLTGTRDDGVDFVQNSYDDEGRVFEQKDAKGETSFLSYPSDDLVEIKDRLGNIQNRRYDILGRLVEQVEATGAEKRYSYDENGNMTSYTDPNGNVFSKTYDDIGNLVASTDPLGNTVVIHYEDSENPYLPTRVIDAMGNATVFTYDSRGNRLTETSPMGHTTSYTYDPQNGNLLTTTDPIGAVTSFSYTDKGELASVTDPLGAETLYDYDNLGRRTAVTDRKGERTEFAYDANGSVISITTPDTATTSFEYDAMGELVRIVEPDGAVTTLTRNLIGKIASQTAPDGSVLSFDYDAEDRIEKREDPLGRKARFARDEVGQPLAATEAYGSTAAVTAAASYDLTGNRLTLTDPRGNVTTYNFDAMGRVMTETDPLGHSVTNGYDARGMLVSITNGRDQTAAFSYDASGRLTGIEFPDSSSLSHELDANGNRLRSVNRNSGTINRTFDKLGRLLTRTDEFNKTVHYTYDQAGNIVTLTYSDGLEVHYVYDNMNRLTRVTDWAGLFTEYAYDSASRLMSARLPDGSEVSYGYDTSGRITVLTDTAPDGTAIFTSDYNYNGAGLLISVTSELPLLPNTDLNFSIDAANQITSLNGCEDCFDYDADGNLKRGLIGGFMTDLDYDELGQLVQMGQDTYRYDAEGLRVETTIGGVTRRYVQDPNAALSRLLEEYDVNGNIVARYVYGMGLISREDASGQTLIYHYDHRGNTVALTDEEGTVTDRYAYTPYGRLVGGTGDTPHPFKFNGRDGVMDDGNGLYFMRNRYYAPDLMRFIQRDSLYRGTILATQSLNRYAYTAGMPNMAIDPEGDFWNIVIGAVVGTVVGVVSEVITDAIEGKWDWEDYLIAGSAGFISGALAGSGVGAFAAGSVYGALYSGGMEIKQIAKGEKELGWDSVVNISTTTLLSGAAGSLGSKISPFSKLASKNIGWSVADVMTGGFLGSALATGALEGRDEATAEMCKIAPSPACPPEYLPSTHYEK
jgi:RHS repeat-associated protein